MTAVRRSPRQRLVLDRGMPRNRSRVFSFEESATASRRMSSRISRSWSGTEPRTIPVRRGGFASQEATEYTPTPAIAAVRVTDPIIPRARARQATCNWVASTHAIARGLGGDVRAVAVCCTPLSVCHPVCISAPAFPSHPSRGRPPRASLRRFPPPSCATCPAPATVARRRAPLGCGPLGRGCRTALGGRQVPGVRGTAGGGGGGSGGALA